MPWYHYLNSCENSLLKRENITKDMVLICNEGFEGKKTYTSMTFNRAFNFNLETSDDERAFFEIILGDRCQKPYFDIDINLENDYTSHSREQKIAISKKLPEEIKINIMKCYPQILEEDILVFNSHSNKKRSYHIVVTNWCVSNSTNNRKFFNEVMKDIPFPWKQYVDDSMYKSIQQFRMFMSSKYKANRHKTFDPDFSTWQVDEFSMNPLRDLFFDSLITYTRNCNIIHYEEDENSHFDYEKTEITDSMQSKIKNFVKMMKDGGCFSFGRCDSSILLLRRNLPSYCNVCKRSHDNENPFVYVKINGDVCFNCRRAKESVVIGNVNQEIIETKTVKKRVNNNPKKDFFELIKETQCEDMTDLDSLITKESSFDETSLRRNDSNSSFSGTISTVSSPALSIESNESCCSTTSQESWRVKRFKEKHGINTGISQTLIEEIY